MFPENDARLFFIDSKARQLRMPNAFGIVKRHDERAVIDVPFAEDGRLYVQIKIDLDADAAFHRRVLRPSNASC